MSRYRDVRAVGNPTTRPTMAIIVSVDKAILRVPSVQHKDTCSKEK
jgi:hypothetical protein